MLFFLLSSGAALTRVFFSLALGHALDEMQAHRFLEAFDMTLTVRKMREALREKGAIGDKV